MIDTHVSLLALLVLGLVIVLLVLASKTFLFSNGPRSPGPFGYVFYYTYIIMVIPGLVYFVAFDRTEVLVRGVSPSTFEAATLWLVYGLIVPIIIVWLLGGRVNRFSLKAKPDSDKVVIVLVSLLTAMSLSYIYVKVGDLPVFHFLTGEIRQVRKLARPDISAYSPFWKSLVDTLAPFSFAYLGALVGVRVKVGVGWLLLLFSTALIASIWSGEKANVVVNMFFMYLAYLYVSGKKFDVLRVAFFVVSGVAVLLVVYIFSYGYDSLGLTLEHIYRRAMFGQIVGYYQGLEYLEPDIRRTANFVPASSVFGVSGTPVGRELMGMIHGETDTNNQILSFYLMEAWAAWGVYGLFVSPFIVGLALVFWPVILVKVVNNFVGFRFCLSAVFSLMLSLRMSGGFSYFAFSKGIVFPLAVFTCMALFVCLMRSVVYNK